MYLVELCNFLPPEELRFDGVKARELRFKLLESSQEYRENQFSVDDPAVVRDVMEFQYKILEKSGLGLHGTYLPQSLHTKYSPIKCDSSIPAALEEAHMCLTGAMKGLLDRAGLQPRDIDILVTTCSVFCPTPSMASMVVNAFKMRSDIQSYHLGGMGCSNGVVAVNLVQDLLKAHPNCNAVLLTTETVTPAFYRGIDKHRQVTNMIFRMGAAGVLFSNKPAMIARAKYVLTHNIRVHLAASDDAYSCIHHGPDDKGIVGTYLSKDVVKEASRGLTLALTKVGPKILNWSQIAAYLMNAAQRQMKGKKSVPQYKPRFSDCIDHFLIHAGGAAILKGIGKELQLDEQALAPSAAVLHDFGNVSSSSTWYTLGYVESVLGVKKGARILQVGVGSGVKCGVNVWHALHPIRDVQPAWAARLSPTELEAAEKAKARLRRGGRSASDMALTALLVALVAVLLAALYHYLSGVFELPPLMTVM